MTRPVEQNEPTGDNQPQAIRQASPSRLRGWLWTTASVIALAGLTFGIVHLMGTSNPHPDASSTRAAVSTASPRLSPDAAHATNHAAAAQPRTAAALGLDAGAMPLPDRLKIPVAAWDTGRGGGALAVVSAQLGDVTQSGGLREYLEMKAACSTLAIDVRTAQADPPIPDAAMQALYAKALTNIATGAADCGNAISEQPDGDENVLTHENQTMLQQSASAFTVGAKELYRATAEIEVLRLH